MKPRARTPHIRQGLHQRGLVLPSVMAVALGVAMLVLSGMHQLWWQARLLKLEGQRLRHRALAQAVLTFAAQDLRSPLTLPDGSPNWRQQMGDVSQTHVFFPQTLAQREVLRTRLGSASCREGICVTDNAPHHTEALPSPTLAQWATQTAQAQPIPVTQWPDAAATHACYWIEVLVNANDTQFYYRITALVQGGLPGARVALQAVWQRDAAGQGHWLSRQWLAL